VDADSQKNEKPENIIFLIGDGMGLSAVSAGFYYSDSPSQFYRFKTIGLQKTNSATHKVTDSAASGTAMATGIKTYNGAIGVDTTKKAVTNITEVVSKRGWSTGVVATSTISHATPASFYAHVEQRSNEPEICAQLLTSEIDFFAGGGAGHFTSREDGRNLLEEAVEAGFQVDTVELKSSRVLHPKEKYGFLLNAGAMPNAEVRGSFLPDASALAIEHLSGNKKGFFLMVEGSQIDWAGHANDSDYLLGEQLDFEKVIKVAMDFAEKDGNTLVVVTADHETGGFTLAAKKDEESGRDDYVEIGPRFATGSHSATLIPVFAYGPGADSFEGIYENTEIFEKMKALSGK
jgi:alkaline phosphatase